MLERTKTLLPEFAKDARLNLIKVLDFDQREDLTEDQILGASLALAYHLKNEHLIADLLELNPSKNLMTAAKLAASLMAMTNIYYRFIHLSENADLSAQPANLRMQGMMNSGVDKITFEILSLAVSALNGCGACISAHTRQLIEHGISVKAIARIGRLTAVLHAVHISQALG